MAILRIPSACGLVFLMLLGACSLENEGAGPCFCDEHGATLYFSLPSGNEGSAYQLFYTLGGETEPLEAGVLMGPDFVLQLSAQEILDMGGVRIRAAAYDAGRELHYLRYWESSADDLIGAARVIDLVPLPANDNFPMPPPYPDHRLINSYGGFADRDTLRDTDGIPLRRVWGYEEPVQSRHWICKVIIGNFDRWMETGEVDYRTRALFLTDWLLTRSLETPLAGLACPEPFDFESRVWLSAPWSGAFTQGLFLSALKRAHIMSGEARYLEAAEAAFRCYTLPAGHFQGISCIGEGSRFWPEEYPSFPPQHTLNGAIYSIFYVLDWWFYTGSPQAERIYRSFIHTLEAELHLYDTGSWTYYDQWQKLAPQNYHEIHVSQMNYLHEQTGLEIFAEYRDIWNSYLGDTKK